MNKKVAVIGAGNGGMAISAYLSLSGASVNLCDLFPEYTADIIKEGGIKLVGVDKTGFAKMNLVTNNISDAIKDVRLIMIVAPAFAHKMIAQECSKYLEDGQIVVLNPGRTAGALCFLNEIRKNKCTKDVIVAETQTLIYSCRKHNGFTVEIKGVKRKVDIASIPANKVGEVINALGVYYPQFEPRESVIYTSLANIGSMFHPAPTMMNIGRIESDKNGFQHYKDGMSQSVVKFIEKLDEERLNVAEGFSVEIRSIEEWLKDSYKVSGKNVYELIQSNEAYRGVAAPKTLDVRYVKEDVPTGLVPISELGKIARIPTPNIDAVITILSTLYGIDFRKEGRNLESLGIKDMDKARLMHYFKTGKP
ncbi:NAD/NADP-dependent octopine/nopaline dehydrogenase family protein [Lutispora saccharofermentans]|uniref:NAD/NADP octopine/nopaline dehydrogenase family protein n=1 Tax=Lutispora saccharofermentans TaxID=3024236 RepID=A0ABT1NI08_9FIRM|nr:NAD/NADP-dependent octopine/nopaline dehydrogenase family protein [Lutispora saccharofermentans]MCQ1530224.1 NAD/NADP octopine/nopaline dehydrogenase family protein [Lutispora saccharofermentans]